MFTTVLGRGGTIPEGFQFETALQMHAWQDLSGIGAPVRVFLLSDLLRENFPADQIRLAVFLNAFMVNDELREAVKTKIQTGGRTAAWIFAPGLFNGSACAGGGSCLPSIAAASDLVGIPLSMHAADTSLTTTFVPHAGGNGPIIAPPLAGSSYGQTLGMVSPRLSCDEGGSNDHTLVLGRYNQVVSTAGGAASSVVSSNAAICYRTTQNKASTSNSVFIGAPRPPLRFWRSLAKSAGVFIYTDGAGADDEATNSHADSVEMCVSRLSKHALKH